jgi:AcrR family transcriptional regulator
MTGPTAKPLNGKQTKALSALLCSATLAEAAKKSNVPERSLYRYLRTPHFADAYREARSKQVQQAICQIQRISTKAAMTLETIMTDPLTKATARVLACRTILHTALQAVELEDLQARLTALEQSAQEAT